MRILVRSFAALAATLVLVSPAMSVEETADCEAKAGVTPVCGFRRPEDLELVADRTRILVSEYGGISGEMPGALVLFDPASGAKRALYPGAGRDTATMPAWGDDTCPGPPGPGFAPHGIHHSDVGGARRVLAVNHGGRESVELFEITVGDGPGDLALVWRGCVPIPAEIWANDVVGLPGDALAVSHMIAPGTGEEALYAAEAARADTGWVTRWHRDTGWQTIAGTQGGLPNGIEISADGKVLFVNEYLGDRVRAVELASGIQRWAVDVPAPDNSGWTSDGKLLVASHLAPLADILACNAAPLRPCAVPYQIVSIDIASGDMQPVYRGGIDDPMGGATVAIEFAGDIYAGSFVGDRLVRFNGNVIKRRRD